MFYNCHYINEINFTIINTEELVDLSKMFYNCDGLFNINFTGLNIKNVKNT
jgi:hypothetical protein